jgi:hypothetical protein
VPRTYDAEFAGVWWSSCGRVGPRVVAVELGLAEATVYRWKARTSSTVG